MGELKSMGGRMSKFNSEMNIIKEKPGLYIGKKNFTRLLGFIHGFLHAESVYQVVEDHSRLFPLPFHFFHEFVRVKLGYFESTSGWYNMIMDKNKHDEEASFDDFFRLYEEFNHLTIQNSVTAILTEENKHFHINDPGTPKSVIDFDGKENWILEPYFSNPEKLFLIKMSNNMGYLKVILTKKECFLVFKFSRTKKKSMEHFHENFGEDLNWFKSKWEDGLLINREMNWT
ncbi:hypothetical protein [Cohnella sp. GCM10012308]|uniref:hypothetical protein n=1 Tax=Cohnella sp. GCM10012308 TaxID=3317329 RepID=UPI003607B41E